MIERIKKAIDVELQRQFDSEALGWYLPPEKESDYIVVDGSVLITPLVSSIIAAMREPTSEMVEAGTEADWVGENEDRAGWSINPSEHGPGVWQAMVDAALDETNR